jgi:hypothetical protein
MAIVRIPATETPSHKVTHKNIIGTAYFYSYEKAQAFCRTMFISSTFIKTV